jgi:hypothetical protein
MRHQRKRERERKRQRDGESRDVGSLWSARSKEFGEQRLKRLREKALSGSNFRLGLAGGRRRGGDAELKKKKMEEEEEKGGGAARRGEARLKEKPKKKHATEVRVFNFHFSGFVICDLAF